MKSSPEKIERSPSKKRDHLLDSNSPKRLNKHISNSEDKNVLETREMIDSASNSENFKKFI